MNYTFAEPDAEERHTTQYFEIFGNRGIYDHGWTAVTAHRAPWLMATHGLELTPMSEDRWELYDTSVDWSQARDLADEHPEILARLKEKFLVEAAKYQSVAAGRQNGRSPRHRGITTPASDDGPQDPHAVPTHERSGRESRTDVLQPLVHADRESG